MPDRFMPVEWPSWGRGLPRPEHPGGENAVEEGLHQRGAEESRALVPLELHAQRLLQRRTHRGQGSRIPRRLDPGQAVASVGRQQPSQVFRFGKRRAVGQGAREVFRQAGAYPAGRSPGRFQEFVKLPVACRQPEGLQLGGIAIGVLPNQHEVPGVGDQHQPVLVPVLAHLSAFCRQPGVVLGRLDLDDTAFRALPLTRRSLLHLLGCVEADVWMTCALIGKLDNAKDLGFERGAHGVEQVGQRRIVGQFRGGAAGGAHLPETGQVLFHGWRQFRPTHRIPQRFTLAADVPAVECESII